MRRALALLALACLGADDCTGALSADEVQTAKGQAAQYARDLGYAPLGIACVNRDSDGDGYVSCMVRIDGQPSPLSWECGYGRWNVSGCREAKARIGGAQ